VKTHWRRAHQAPRSMKGKTSALLGCCGNLRRIHLFLIGSSDLRDCNAKRLFDFVYRTVCHPIVRRAGVSLYEGSAAEQTMTPFAVERANKTDRMAGALNGRGEYVPAISVEVAGKSDAVVTVRDRDGRMLYRLDPAERTTIVSKRIVETLASRAIWTWGGSATTCPIGRNQRIARRLRGCVQPVCGTQHGECNWVVFLRSRTVCRSRPDKK